MACAGCKKEFGKARRQPDGSVMYVKKGQEPPPDLDGFSRDPQNPWRFIPLWQACDWRYQTQYLKQCGALAVRTTCRNPDGPTGKGQVVEFNHCQACQLCKIK